MNISMDGETCGAVVALVVGAIVGAFITMGVLMYDAKKEAQVEMVRIATEAGMEQHQRIGASGWYWAYPEIR